MWPPSSPAKRAEANLTALETLRVVEAEGRPASRAEQELLAAWSSWGALPKVFDPSDGTWADVRERLGGLLDEKEMSAAALTTINAHYTNPDVVASVWAVLGGLGFAGGRVLEPGCGSGTFIGLAPESASMVGVELDPTTARIASLLYPSAEIRAEGFETTRVPDGAFVGAVGNVPFGKVALHDPIHNRQGHSIHNHFIIKALGLCAPGGMVAVVTSRYTLDATNPAARREMAGMADLVGAIRLPGGAMRRVAGTDVVCDVLVLRRREQDRDADSTGWERAVDVDVPGGRVRMSEYFATHPEMVLGEVGAGRGMYGDGELMVEGTLDALPEQLAAAGRRLVASGRERELLFAARPGDEVRKVTVDVGALRSTRAPKLGSLVETESGFARMEIEGLVAHEPPRSRRGELRALIGLRDVTLDLIDAQAEGAPVEVRDRLRGELNTRYDAYLAKHGPIKRWRWSNPSGDTEARKVYPAMGGFRSDPDFPTLAALEDFDADEQIARKMPIFTRDVIAPAVKHLGADTPGDALAITLGETGKVDVGRVADLLGVPVDEARAGLDGLVFDDPVTGETVTSAEYLSGDVRTKLVLAEHAADRDERWSVNVEALRTVQPRDLLPEEITARPGAPWIPDSDVEAFIAEVLEIRRGDVSVTQLPSIGEWKVEVPSWSRRSARCTVEFGTDRADAVRLLDSALNGRQVEIKASLPEGGSVLLAEETALARERQAMLVERFESWVWEDPDRADRLAGEYNRRFNSHVHRHFDGGYLELPGMATSFTPRPHQRDAVARVLSEPSVLLDHAVGAGKTGTMAAAGMELRRLGMARQPWYVVPNHMLEQFAAEFKQWYPGASLLVARDLTSKTRREFVARSVTGEWDGVVITQSAFKLLSVSKNVIEGYLGDEVARMREAIVEGTGKIDVKKLERTCLAREQKLRATLAKAGTDVGVAFDSTGCDYLFVDEAHMFKNLAAPSGNRMLTIDGSVAAEDLAMKLHWLRSKGGERIVTFATGTPVANSIREMYIMQKFLRPERLDEAGLTSLDTWAAQFVTSRTVLELDPTGAKHRLRDRIVGFQNAPELISMYREFSDVMLPEDLDLPVPECPGGRQVRVLEPCESLTEFIEDLGRRAELIAARAVSPDEDNMLKITGEGRLAALDPRCVGLERDPTGGKAAAITAEVMRIERATAARRYSTPSGDPSPTPGGLQIIFCDRSTPKPGEWNFYDELKRHLVAAGMDESRIRFVHEAKGDRQKKEDLFAECRAGKVSVLVGSTELMGVGTNIQARATALHHADCPWRPADLEQREGRVLRQGNQNDEVEIITYATEGSFDTYMWQLMERKARFIGQIRSGDVTARTVDDVGDDQALSFAEIKALASGDPLVMERAGVEAEVAQLEKRRAMHSTEQSRITNKLQSLGKETTRLGGVLEAAELVRPRLRDVSGDRFAAHVSGISFTDRTKAGAELVLRMGQAFTDARLNRETDEVIGNLAGVDLRLRGRPNWDLVRVELVGFPGRTFDFDRGELKGANPLGFVRQLENRIGSLDRVCDDARTRLGEIDAETESLTALVGRPFEGQDRLNAARTRLGEIDSELAEKAAADTPPPEGDCDTSPGGASVTEPVAHPDVNGPVGQCRPVSPALAQAASAEPRVSSPRLSR